MKTDDAADGWTALGIGLFTWRLWRLMSDPARVLWLALYASAEARRCPPGLWHGGPAAMSEASEQPVGVVVVALQELERIGAVEFDPDPRVARLLELPDRLLRPPNGNHVLSWWRRWRNMPACAVRDRHLPMLRALLEPMTAHHAKAWSATFGTLSGDVADLENRSGNGSGNGSRDRSGNRRDQDQGSGRGKIQISSRSSLQDTAPARARDPSAPGEGGEGEDPPPAIDDPVLAEVVSLAHKAFAHHGAKRARGGGA